MAYSLGLAHLSHLRIFPSYNCRSSDVITTLLSVWYRVVEMRQFFHLSSAVAPFSGNCLDTVYG